MGAVTAYPSDKIGCYQDLNYTYSVTVTGNANPPAIEVDVIINTEFYRTIFLATYETLTVVSSDYVYTFNINIADAVQSYFDNNEFLHSATRSYPYSATDLTANVVLDVYDYIPNVDGVLTRDASAFRSNSRLFFNSLQNDMTDYTAATGRKFMTTNEYYRLSKQCTNTLAVFADSNADTIRIATTAATTDISLTRDKINIINLNDYFDANTVILRAYVGTLDDVDFIQTGEMIEYRFVTEECEPIFLHFQNRLGTSEVFMFKNYEYEVLQEIQRDNFVTSNNKVKMFEGQLDKVISVNREGFFVKEWENFRQVNTSAVFKIEENFIIEDVYANYRRTPFRTANNEIDVSLEFVYSDEQKIFSN